MEGRKEVKEGEGIEVTNGDREEEESYCEKEERNEGRKEGMGGKIGTRLCLIYKGNFIGKFTVKQTDRHELTAR